MNPTVLVENKELSLYEIKAEIDSLNSLNLYDIQFTLTQIINLVDMSKTMKEHIKERLFIVSNELKRREQYSLEYAKFMGWI